MSRVGARKRKETVMTLFRLMPLVTGILLIGLSQASACRSTNVLATAADANVGQRTDIIKSGPNQFSVMPQADRLSVGALIAVSTTPHPSGLCADVQMLTTPDASDSGVGVTFWGSTTSDDDYYFMEIHNDQYRVVHILFGKWYVLLPLITAPVIKTGANSVNEVEVWFTPTGAELWINGTRVNQIVAHPADANQNYGVFGESPKTGQASMQIRSFRLLK